MQADISVIMSVYNESTNVLKKAIDSIVSQTCEPQEFIIVVDNPNNSSAIELIEEYSKKNKNISSRWPY